MFFSSIKKINRLIRKGMYNINVKVTAEKTNVLKTFHFLSLNHSSPGQFLEGSNHADIMEFQIFFLQFKNQRPRSKCVRDFSIILILKGIMTF